MHCHRCKGFMVSERLPFALLPLGESLTQVWRCVNCGEIMDRMIALNRSRRPPEK